MYYETIQYIYKLILKYVLTAKSYNDKYKLRYWKASFVIETWS